MDSPDMEIEDENYEPVKNSKSPVKKTNLDGSNMDNSVSKITFYI